MKYLYTVIAFILIATGTCKADDKALFEEMNKIASSGNPEAQYHLGMFYNNGIGTEKNIKKAFEVFQQSSDGGDPLGSYKLGCYYYGQGESVVQEDHDSALKYKIIAAKAGYDRAQYDVANIFAYDQDYKNAIIWWKKAALQGYPSAFNSLFAMYYNEQYNLKDWGKAFQYLKIIEQNIGVKKKQKISEKVREIEPTLTQAQLSQAQKFVENFRPQQTELTIKAYSGKKQSIKFVEQFK